MRTIKEATIDQQVILKDSEYKTANVVGILPESKYNSVGKEIDGGIDLYLLGYYIWQPRHKDSWTNERKYFPNFVLSDNVAGFSYFIIVDADTQIIGVKE